jgi:hypothetical protein
MREEVYRKPKAERERGRKTERRKGNEGRWRKTERRILNEKEGKRQRGY